MPNTILYIASSLDGFIAKPDGNLDWLTGFPPPQQGDYGYQALLERIGTIIMGRKTYDELLGFGIEWPYMGFETFVITSQPGLAIQSPDTFLVTSNLKEFMLELKSAVEKDIWIVGGGALISSLLKDQLIDEMILSVIPKIIGNGIPLFPGPLPESEWILRESEAFSTGLVNLYYFCKK